MTCADARHHILIVDLSALLGETNAGLRAHLAECAECSAAASRIVGETNRLRSALIARGSQAGSAPRRARQGRLAMSLIPMALAAEIALIVFFSNRSALPGMERRAIDDSVTTLLPPAVVSPVIHLVTTAPRKTKLAIADVAVVTPESSAWSESTRVAAALAGNRGSRLQQSQAAPANPDEGTVVRLRPWTPRP